MEDYSKKWSTLVCRRYEKLDCCDQAWDLYDKYIELHTLCDFWTMFHHTPQFKAIYGDDFEAFGRTLGGLNWVFDHTNTPSEFREYMDLYKKWDSEILTLVPEGSLVLHDDKGEWEGLGSDDWEFVLQVTEGCYIADRLEDGQEPSGREKRLIELLEQRNEIIDRMDNLRISYLSGGRKLIYHSKYDFRWVLCDPADGSIVARPRDTEDLSREDMEWKEEIIEGSHGVQMEPKHLTSGLQTSIWTVFGKTFAEEAEKEERESQSDNEDNQTEEAA
jgi:hypothetical protein